MARRLIRSMRHQSMVLDVVTYGAAIGACARAGRYVCHGLGITDKVMPCCTYDVGSVSRGSLCVLYQ